MYFCSICLKVIESRGVKRCEGDPEWYHGVQLDGPSMSAPCWNAAMPVPPNVLIVRDEKQEIRSSENTGI